MKIAIIGNGNVGSALAGRLTGLGHEVSTANSTTAVDVVAKAVSDAEITVLAVPHPAVAGLDERIKAATAGKVVVDATNPLAADFMSLTVGHDSSAGEQNAAALPGARIVKAFNTVFAANLASGELGGQRQFLPVAGDDASAKQLVLTLAEEMGFDAVDVGALTNARYTEPAVELLIQLAFGAGHGPGIGYVLARV